MAEVMGEIDPTTGKLWYDRAIITTQRQVGKTDNDVNHSLALLMQGRDRIARYTAQSGQHASDHFIGVANAWDEMPADSILKRAALTPRRSNGSQSLTFLNASYWRPYPPTENALHGKQSDKVTIDEAWAFSHAAGTAILGGAGATMLTREMKIGQKPQIFIQSTEGTIESTWFNPMLDEQRARDLTDFRSRTAFFDFGLREDDDATDLEVVASRHPGYGYLFNMSTLEQMADLFKDAPGEFARAYGNRRSGSSERLFPERDWQASGGLEALPEGRVAVGAAVGVDGVDTSIVYAVRQGDRIVVEVAENRPGTTWALARLLEIQERAGDNVGAFAIDRYGPSSSLADQAERAGLALIPLTTSNVAAASSNLFSWVTEPLADGTRAWRYVKHAALEQAAELATRRFVQDGAWTLGRRLSVGSISALEAANLATWAVDHMPEKQALQIF